MNKPRFLWYSYDFANSFAGIVLIFYFPLILLERGGAEQWIGIASSAATALMLLFLPRLGHYADLSGKSRMVILAGTLVSVGTLCALSLVLTFGPDTFSTVIVALILYGVFYIGYESALTVYAGLLRRLGEDGQLAKISGFGYAMGQFGNVCGLLLTKALIGTGILFLGISGKPLGLLLGGLFALCATLPFIYSLPATLPNTLAPKAFSYVHMMRVVMADRKLLLFLLGTLLIFDTILTFQIYVASYLKVVFGFSETLVLMGGALGLFGGTIGALMSGYLVSKARSSNVVLILVCLLYTSCLFLVGLAHFDGSDPYMELCVLALSGISYGMVFSLGRSIYATLIPAEAQHEYFGIYTVFERMAAVVGPLVWVMVFVSFAEYGAVTQYRMSAISLGCIACLSCYLFYRFVKVSKDSTAPQNS